MPWQNANNLTFERLRPWRKLNHKQRKEVQQSFKFHQILGWRLYIPMPPVLMSATKATTWPYRPGRDAHPVREFGSWTAALIEMAQWLKSCGVHTVVMQSTGVYWIAVHDVLRKPRLCKSIWSMPVAPRVCLDARVTCRNVSGLCGYIPMVCCGAFFLPAPEIHGVRTIWRLRDQHVKDAGRCIQHMQKTLIEMNVQLHIAISDHQRYEWTGYYSRSAGRTT